jgi:DNA-3-methyladenine glycosylase
VARDLLGKVLTFKNKAARIVETEAYLGEDDEAAHSARGITPRTRVIFGPPGHAYVYFVYGMHHCLNIVCEPEGVAGCVLIRALEGFNGPARLTKGFGINLAHNGADLTSGPITIHQPRIPEKFKIASSPRIGISKSADLPLRFFIEGHKSVSR